MPFILTPAQPPDIPALTSIFLTDDMAPSSSSSAANDTTSFTQLCLGSVDRRAINMRQSAHIGQGLADEGTRWIVARDVGTKKTAAFAEWRLPTDEASSRLLWQGDVQGYENEKEDEEAGVGEADAEREAYRQALTPGMNTELCVRFKDEIETLRRRALTGRRHYLLMNLATPPAFRRQGAATALVRWPFAEADATNTIVYLDTAVDGPGRSLYERLGFERVGECSIQLEEYGGKGVHVHIAMIRHPHGRTQDGAQGDAGIT